MSVDFGPIDDRVRENDSAATANSNNNGNISAASQSRSSHTRSASDENRWCGNNSPTHPPMTAVHPCSDVSPETEFDLVLSAIGDFGRYQRTVFAAVCVFAALANIPSFVQLVFQPYIPEYRCRIPGCDVLPSANTSHPNTYNTSFLPFTIPSDSKSGALERCRRFWRSNITSDICDADQFDQNITVTCTDFVFDRSVFSTSFVSQWSLTCEYQSLVELPSTMFFSGVLIGSLVFGFVSDKYGRRCALSIAVLLLTLANTGTVIFSTSFVSVCAFRVLVGMSSLGLFQTALVLCIEMVGKRWRVLCGSALNVFTTLGVLLALLLAFWQRDWLTLQVISSTPLLLLAALFWLFPESVRWLITQQRFDEALSQIEKMARFNRRSLPDHLSLCRRSHSEVSEPPAQPPRLLTVTTVGSSATDDSIPLVHTELAGSIVDCLQVCSLRFRLFVVLLAWFSVNLAFYGLVTDMQNLPGDFFTNILIMTLAELPGYVLSWPLMDWLGRRFTFVGATLIGGVAAICAGMVPDEYSIANAAFLVASKCGSCVSFAVVYIFTSELFPTPARNTAVGLCSTCGRVAAILAPQITNLAEYGDSIPLLVIGVSSILSGLFTVLLPETAGTPLPETLQQAIDIGKRRDSVSSFSDGPLLPSDNENSDTD